VPVYAYKGVTTAGKATRGSITAESAKAARSRMRRDGIFLTDLTEASETGTGRPTGDASGPRFDLSFLRRIPAMERALATRQLSTLVAAGVPLVEALGALVQQIEHQRLRSVMNEVRDRVNEGSSLADALQNTGQFDTLYVSMIRAGEAGGAIELVLQRIADYLEDQVRLTSKVTSILVYPAVMLLFAMLVVAALVTVVLPQITSLLQSLDQPLPFYTVWIINGSEFMRSYWWALGIGAVLAAFAWRAVLRTDRGRATYDRLILRVPVVGTVVRQVSVSRITRTLATLLSGGVGIVHSLGIARHVANNWVMAEAIDAARTSILEGASLAAPLRSSGQFPAMVTTMIEVGEQSGELSAMLAKVAQTYDEQVETAITRLTALLEPLLILLMVGLVLVIILATLMPLLQITGALN
jgi:general secretion pathway protein F